MFLKASVDAVEILQGFCLLLFINLSTQDVQVDITGPTHPVPVGSSVTLTCHTQYTGSLWDLAFVKDDGTVPGRSTDNPQTISFPSLKKSDAGQYRCSAITSSSGNREEFYTLQVTAPPKLEHAEYTPSLLYPPEDKFSSVAALLVSGDNIGPYDFTAPPGMSLEVTIYDSVYDGIPTKNYYLTPKLDIKDDTAGVLDPNVAPTCDKLRRPGGLYHFWFTDHPIKVNFQLEVYYRATWGSSSRNLTAYIGEPDVHITCDVCANPKVTYEWRLDLYPLDFSSQTILIENVAPSDFGTYQCTTTNTIRGITRSPTFSITLTEDRNKGGSGGIPGYVYLIIAGMVLLLLVAIAVYHWKRRKKLNKGSAKEDADSPAVVFGTIPLAEGEMLPASQAEPIYENGPANHRFYTGQGVHADVEPTNKKQPELTYCQLDFDTDNNISGSPQKERRVQVPRAADEYTEYAEITGTLDRGK